MLALSTLGAQAMACYTFDPSIGSTPPLGTRVALDINDAGRVALGGSMSPEIGRITGRLVAADSNEYLVNVTGLRSMRGMEQVWAGEPVRIRHEYVSALYQQHFSAVRTTALVAATGVVVASVAAKALEGFATPTAGSGRLDTAQAIRFPFRGRRAGLIKRW